MEGETHERTEGPVDRRIDGQTDGLMFTLTDKALYKVQLLRRE